MAGGLSLRSCRRIYNLWVSSDTVSTGFTRHPRAAGHCCTTAGQRFPWRSNPCCACASLSASRRARRTRADERLDMSRHLARPKYGHLARPLHRGLLRPTPWSAVGGPVFTPLSAGRTYVRARARHSARHAPVPLRLRLRFRHHRRVMIIASSCASSPCLWRPC